jgi:hypothetical protein
VLEWLLTYAGQVIGGLLTILALWKDAKDYGELSKRWGRAIVTFVAVGILLFFLRLDLPHSLEPDRCCSGQSGRRGRIGGK